MTIRTTTTTTTVTTTTKTTTTTATTATTATTTTVLFLYPSTSVADHVLNVSHGIVRKIRDHVTNCRFSLSIVIQPA